MNKEQVTKLIGKIKETVGENNYKLALAITGHRPGKIRDVTMASKDGELLLEYIDNLEQQIKKQKEVIDKAIKKINDYKIYCKENKGFTKYTDIEIEAIEPILIKMEDILKEVSE